MQKLECKWNRLLQEKNIQLSAFCAQANKNEQLFTQFSIWLYQNHDVEEEYQKMYSEWLQMNIPLANLILRVHNLWILGVVTLVFW